VTRRAATGLLASNLTGHIDRLCSVDLAGRLVGTAGEIAARDYLTAVLAASGFDRAPGHAEPFDVTIPFLARVPRLVVDGIELEYLIDFCVNVQGAANGGTGAGPCVWMGSQLPDGRVAKRVVACAPSAASSPAEALEGYLRRHRVARDSGAQAILQVCAEHRRGKLMMHRTERPGLPSLDVSPGVVRLIFGTNDPPVGAIGAGVNVEVALQAAKVTSAGNVAMQVGSGPVSVVLVAHYDHVGTAADGRHFPGAADNASGVAVVLEAARQLVGVARSRRLVVLLTAAEEAGMRGARHYVAHHPAELATGPLVVNVDEIGGCPHQPLLLLLNGPAPESLGRGVGWPVALRPRGAGFADATAFLPDVPTVLSLTSASRPGVVHTVADIADGLSVPKLVAATNLLVQIVRELPTSAPSTVRA
jgi:aminopeptidase YwaD